MSNRVLPRSTKKNINTQSRTKLSARCIPITAIIIVASWCVFITLRPPQHVVVNNSYDTDKTILASIKESESELKVKSELPSVIDTKDVINNNINTITSANINTDKIVNTDNILSDKIIPPEHSAESSSVGPGSMHVVFSTDCTFYQDWQTLLVFHSALVVGQKGTITRIASGCDDEKKQQLSVLYQKLFPMYHIHFTPNFKLDKKTGKEYDFYNKPYGVDHWLENAVPKILDDVVIAIIDPDMIFLRPLTVTIKEDNTIFLSGSTNIPLIIKKGVPAAQQYGLGAPWASDYHKHFNRLKICGEGSPCLKVIENEGAHQYRYSTD